MKVFPVIAVLALSACGGSLSDDQRKQMRERMEENKIVRITEIEITEAAFEEGRRLVRILDSLNVDSAALRTFVQGYPGTIRFLTSATPPKTELERQLFEAYRADTITEQQENVQNVRNEQGEVDSLLYTFPLMERSASNTRLSGVWSIWLSKKELVKDIGRKKED